MIESKLKKLLLFFVVISNPLHLFAINEFQKWQEKQYAQFMMQLKYHLQREGLFSFINKKIYTINKNELPENEKEEYTCQLYLNETLLTLYTNKKSSHLQYKKFLTFYRKALNTNYYIKNQITQPLKKEVYLLQKIAFYFYSKINMDSVQYDLTTHIASSGGYTQFKHLPNKVMNRYHSRLNHLKSSIIDSKMFYQSLKLGKKDFQGPSSMRLKYNYFGGIQWAKFDPNNLGSLPNIKYKMSRSSSPHVSLSFIRMSTPTIGSSKNSRINPEFKAYITYLKNKGLKHVYINLQDNRHMTVKKAKHLKEYAKSIGVVYEAHRAKTIEKFAKTKSLQNTIQVITLGKDNPFYNQQRRNNMSESKEAFIKQLDQYLFDEANKGFYVPAHWRDKSSKEREALHSKLSQSLHTLFPKQDKLSPFEKQNAIEISFLVIIDFLTKDIYSMNITCKDGIDRAGATHGLLYILSLLTQIANDTISDRDFDHKLNKVCYVLFSNAVSVRQREMMAERFARFYDASLFLIDFFQQHPENAKKWLNMFNLNAIIDTANRPLTPA